MKEKTLENRFKIEVKKLGGIAVKNARTGLNGFPDRTAYLPNGVCVPVELKAPGKKATNKQRIWLLKLAGLGFNNFVINSEESLNDFIILAKALINAKV